MMNDELLDVEETSMFRLRFVIKHSNLSPGIITENMRLVPAWSHTAGQARVSPKGRLIGGIYGETVWSFSKEYKNQNFFSHSIVWLLTNLEQCSDFLVKIVETGGNSTLLLDFDGSRGIGDLIGWKILQRISELKVDLSIEVFRDFGSDP